MSQQLHARTHTNTQITFLKCRPRSIWECAYKKCECAKWTAPGKPGTDHFRTFSHSIINFIVHAEFCCGRKKKRKYSSVCATAAGDGTKIIRKVKRAKAYAVQVVLFMFFTYYTAIAQHFNEDRNLFDWALESFVCVCASHEWVFIGIFVIPHSTALKWNSECDQ